MESLREQFVAHGVAQGITQGLAQGRAASLMRVVRHRFGPPPAAVEARIAQASPDELDGLLDQALKASSLEEAFGDTFRH